MLVASTASAMLQVRRSRKGTMLGSLLRGDGGSTNRCAIPPEAAEYLDFGGID
jgi:hypothetical protein